MNLEENSAEGVDLDDPDECRAQNVLVPVEARWPHLRAPAGRFEIHSFADDAMIDASLAALGFGRGSG